MAARSCELHFVDSEQTLVCREGEARQRGRSENQTLAEDMKAGRWEGFDSSSDHP